jgi:hypothetical protein
MMSVDFLNPSSGGIFVGTDKDVIFKDLGFVQHAFSKKDKDGNVTETFKPGCMFAIDLEVEPADLADEPCGQNICAGCPEHRTDRQYYPAGDIPGMGNFGPGGLWPSADNENPDKTPEGTLQPFVVGDGKAGIGPNQPYMVAIVNQLKNLGLGEHSDRLYAQGMHALRGLRVHMGVIVLPQGKKAIEEKREAKTTLGPVAVNAWPWDAAAVAASGGAAVATTAAKPKAAKKAAATTAAPAGTATPAEQAQAAAPTATAAAPAPANDEASERAVAIVLDILNAVEGNKMPASQLPAKVHVASAKEPQRMAIVKLANDAGWRKAQADAGQWIVDDGGNIKLPWIE